MRKTKGIGSLVRWIGVLVLSVNGLAAAGITTLKDKTENIEAGSAMSFYFDAKEGDIIYICRYEQREKGITTFLLDRDDWNDWQNGADAKRLNPYLYISDGEQGETWMEFMFIADKSTTYYLVCDNRSAWIDNKVAQVRILKLSPSISYESALKKIIKRNKGNSVSVSCDEFYTPVTVTDDGWYWGPFPAIEEGSYAYSTVASEAVEMFTGEVIDTRYVDNPREFCIGLGEGNYYGW